MVVAVRNWNSKVKMKMVVCVAGQCDLITDFVEKQRKGQGQVLKCIVSTVLGLLRVVEKKIGEITDWNKMGRAASPHPIRTVIV